MAVKVNEGIQLIELHDVINDVEMVFRPTIIWDDKDVVLIDTGYPGHLEDIKTSLEKLPNGKLTKIIITHHDYDHLGSLYEIIQGFDHKIEVYAHELTKPYIQGEKPLIKTGINVPKTLVDVTVEDGQVLPFCGGITVIFTPGHTPDHIGLYHQDTKTLITGDAMTADQGQLQIPNPKFTLDMDQALVSLNKFLDFDIETAICYHGGVCRDGIKERISTLAAGK
ncbi:MBL fold metallo-hydrolase [Niallia sp. XMNu-256]|uniref:MBL fold metallo-hydrolase n=1 Tax=Niallia sp. XMNu-256 TaxID=3082444 RepID=UPI0030CB39FC